MPNETVTNEIKKQNESLLNPENDQKTDYSEEANISEAIEEKNSPKPFSEEITTKIKETEEFLKKLNNTLNSCNDSELKEKLSDEIATITMLKTEREEILQNCMQLEQQIHEKKKIADKFKSFDLPFKKYHYIDKNVIKEKTKWNQELKKK